MKIKVKEIEIDAPNLVKLSNTNLVNALVKDQQATISTLEIEGVTPSPTDISIDSTGKVVISNSAYHDAVKAKLDSGVGSATTSHVLFDVNIICF